MKIKLQRLFFKLLGYTPLDMPMVQYWKTKESVAAKVTRDDNGSTIMVFEGEDEKFMGYPRGYLLFGKLSKLKHEIKNQIFNESWHLLDKGATNKEIADRISKDVLPRILALAEETRFDMQPPSRFSPAVKEIHRAWTKTLRGEKSYALRDILCFILQEDDSYKFRVQWLAQFFNPNAWYMRFFDPIQLLDKALSLLEHAEVIDDMKERQRLLRRILMSVIDARREKALAFIRELDWKKLRLSKADKYHFRGKYFKVDFDKFEY